MSATSYCDRECAARYIRGKGFPCTAGTLRKYACIGGGPKFRKFGRRVIYEISALDEWIESRLSKPLASTSEAA